ncbi:SDR family NAD(P)-dependent oxidoreductase [Arenibacter sp. F20364]|uniref:SDR family oxidoreductase n=1 Tax=Arenibacter sp. F20364 TaxID=2926415 RepID=UPI001FF1F892|nr:SDR family NAD(P)-dependent oxidoreductase [Arenibacter sp. F20364]MCK0190292.1 SDR family NAD(P)-dependent oxidoreductase [Arenibacter sp. F20364]
MKLNNNTILITGGNSGIGLALGRALLKLNNTVILLGRDKTKLAVVEKEGFATIVCDLESQGAIENAAVQIQNKYPHINILFNNAGVQYNYKFTKNVIPLNRISREININLIGQMTLTQILIPLLSNAEKSIIVNTTSGLGAFPKLDGLVYSASKAAMRNFTTGLRTSLKNSNIRVLEFIPPVTDTEMTKRRDEKKMPAKELVEHILPQLQREKKILTVPKMRIFLWIAFLYPALAHKILSKS